MITKTRSLSYQEHENRTNHNHISQKGHQVQGGTVETKEGRLHEHIALRAVLHQKGTWIRLVAMSHKIEGMGTDHEVPHQVGMNRSWRSSSRKTQGSMPMHPECPARPSRPLFCTAYSIPADPLEIQAASRIFFYARPHRVF